MNRLLGLQETEAPTASIQTSHECGKVASLTQRPFSFPGDIPRTHFCCRLSRTEGHSVARKVRSMKNSSGSNENRTHDLPACSVVPQQTASPPTPLNYTN